MYVPFVASEACCKNTVSPEILQMSIGMLRRWQAKIVFIIGIYWAARSPETERIKMRGRSGRAWMVAEEESAGVALGLVEASCCCLLIYVRARVRAPDIAVVGVREWTEVDA